MKIYHQLGHNYKWALDAHFQNDIGDGFIFSAYSFKYDKFGNSISSYKPEKYLSKSMIDLQFYGKKTSTEGGQLYTYPFHPTNLGGGDSTNVEGVELIDKAIEYQVGYGLKNIIIPVFYHDADDFEKLLEYIKLINNRLKKKKDKKKTGNEKYLMTIPLSNGLITNDDYVEELLQALTHMSIIFDGYYIVCDAKPEYKKKISIDYIYYDNLLKIFTILKSQNFITCHGYANWDALVFNALCNIDYVTIGTYENLRNFNIKRFTEDLAGGPSKGWYFSEKLLNFVRAQELIKLRRSGCLNLIANEKNIFSDIVLDKGYDWNTHKPDVHKNYLLSISKLLSDLPQSSSIQKRAKIFLKKINKARELYESLANDYNVYLLDESGDYHLATWVSIIQSSNLV
jgi:hypothetical protein